MRLIDLRNFIMQKLQQSLLMLYREGAGKPQCFGERSFLAGSVAILSLFGKMPADADSPFTN